MVRNDSGSSIRTLDFIFVHGLAWAPANIVYWFSRRLLVAHIQQFASTHFPYWKRYSWDDIGFGFQINKWKSGRLKKKFGNAFKRQWEKFHDKNDAFKLIQMARRWHFQWRRRCCGGEGKAYVTNRRKLSRSESIYRKSSSHQRESFPTSFSVFFFYFCSFSSIFDLICTQNEFTKWLQSSLLILPNELQHATVERIQLSAFEHDTDFPFYVFWAMALSTA